MVLASKSNKASNPIEKKCTEMKEFVECVQKDTPPPGTGIDRYIPVMIAIAATRLYREKRPVKLSEV